MVRWRFHQQPSHHPLDMPVEVHASTKFEWLRIGVRQSGRELMLMWDWKSGHDARARIEKRF
jgi:hypothetical protein